MITLALVKCVKGHKLLAQMTAFNRTILELKLLRIPGCVDENHLLIEPYWN